MESTSISPSLGKTPVQFLSGPVAGVPGFGLWVGGPGARGDSEETQSNLPMRYLFQRVPKGGCEWGL